MGVPKFTRFICERYPCLLEVLNEYQIPEFDNLYLDMNGIIHCCSHPNDADAHFRITEETIFKNIFLYVEILFRTIKPQKLFFMAVDGVAPRAKINQQRSRRFKSAKEAEVIEAKARAKGEKLPEEARFDSNCITPGTKFMAKLTEQLKYFVSFKMSTDKLWQKCKIILSGPEVPGEGEHKIMDYIRWLKAQPDHDPNTRHCLYGLDADLIMLSLCTHEPHFAVLREEVKYGRNPQKSTTPPEKTKFCLLHVSLLREYMEHEFESVRDKMSFDFDIEKIIDDWILMGFLIGNDFIPHLPNLHIASGALPILYEAYMEVLPTLDGYINEAGNLNLARFEKFMEKLSEIDVKHFQEHQADLKYFEGKTGRKVTENSPEHVKKPFKKDLESLIQLTEEMLLGHSDEEDDFLDTEDSDNETYALEFEQHKRDYYMNKFEYEKVDAEVMREQAEAYITAIQWNLHYYYDGCCSWSWYYPHHYAPYISDIKGFKDLKISFDLGTPFLPFQQLLAVLPAASRSLLPEPYQKLLTEECSPIIDYYPENFKTDLNEKKQEWEAIVLIPFIDEKNLIGAMEPYNAQLTAEEQSRNKHGPMSIIEYTSEDQGLISAPEFFPAVRSYAKITLVDPKEIDVPNDKLVKGLPSGVKLSTYFPGFPTLQYIKHDVKFEKAKVKVFEQPSRGENMLITIHPKESPEIQKLASELLGKIIFIKWPHLLEAFVVAISDGNRKFSLINPDEPYSPENLNREELKAQGLTQWKAEARDVAMAYKSRFGIVVGDIDMLIHARPITGRRYIMTTQGRMSLEKEWASIPCYYPYQSIVKDIDVEQTGNVSHKNISEIFVPKSICFMLGHPHYGSMGEVIEPGVIAKSGRVKVKMSVGTEPDFGNLKKEQHKVKMQYMHGSIAAQRLGISSHLLSRITGSIYVVPSTTGSPEKKQQNIGLNLKYNKKNEELPGYTRRVNGQWMYSSKSVGLIRAYMEMFPKVFEKLVHNVGNDVFNEEDLFASYDDVLDVVTWLKLQSFRTIEPRNCDHEGLEPDIIVKLEKEIDETSETSDAPGKAVIMQVKPHLLFKPGINNGNIAPDLKAKHRLFDRIIAIRENSSVPLGYKGTIIGILGQKNDNDILYDILFDKNFIGGISFTGGAEFRRAKFHASDFINISHGIRAEQDITGIPIIPDIVVKKKQNENQQQLGNSAFVTVSHGNFFPQFNKSGKGGNQGQDDKSTKIKLMKKDNQETKSPAKKGGKKEKKPQQPKKTDVPPSSAPKEAIKKTTTVETSQNSEFQILWNKLQKLPQPSAVDQKPMVPGFPPMGPPTIPHAPMPQKIPDAHARQARDENVSYCARLLNHYQMLGIGMPRYFYTTQNNMALAQIVLPNMQTFYGDLCPDHASAAESAAKKVFIELKLDQVMKPRPFFDLMPPNAWLNVQPPAQPTQPLMLPRPSFPDKPPMRPSPPNWNNMPRMPQPGFTQMAPPRMNSAPAVATAATAPVKQSPGATQKDKKPDGKTITPFVPLQAQKKSCSRNTNKDTKQDAAQKPPPPSKAPKAKPKDNPPKIVKDERPTKENEKTQKDNPPAPKHHKNPRQRRSRIAANFGSTSTANGGEQ